MREPLYAIAIALCAAACLCGFGFLAYRCKVRIVFKNLGKCGTSEVPLSRPGKLEKNGILGPRSWGWKGWELHDKGQQFTCRMREAKRRFVKAEYKIWLT